MIIAIDFDGTIVEQDSPNIGKEKEYAIDTLKEWKKEGHKLILWTCREGQQLEDAAKYCESRGLEFDAINCNIGNIGLDHDCRKVYADWYIDDRGNDYYIHWLSLRGMKSMIMRKPK